MIWAEAELPIGFEWFTMNLMGEESPHQIFDSLMKKVYYNKVCFGENEGKSFGQEAV